MIRGFAAGGTPLHEKLTLVPQWIAWQRLAATRESEIAPHVIGERIKIETCLSALEKASESPERQIYGSEGRERY